MYRMWSLNAKTWRGKANSQARTSAPQSGWLGLHADVNCQQPLHPLLWFPTHCPLPAPHSRRQGRPLPWWPRGRQRQGPEEGTFSVPPCPCQVPGLPRKPWGTGLSVKSQHRALGKALPVLSHSRPQIQRRGVIQGDDPSRQVASSIFSKTSQRGQNQERKWKEAQVPRWLYFPPSLVVLSSFCFTAPSSKGYGNLFNEILWETQQVWLMTCRYKLPDNKGLLKTSGSELNPFWVKVRMLCSQS